MKKVFFLLLLFTIPIYCFDYYTNFTFYYRIWDEYNLFEGHQYDRAPFYGFLNFGLMDIGISGLDFNFSGLYYNETKEDPYKDKINSKNFNLYALYLSYSDSNERFKINLGRFPTFSALKRIYIDGLKADVEIIKRTLFVQLYGGLWREFKANGLEEKRDNVYGINVKLFPYKYSFISVGYHRRPEKIDLIYTNFHFYLPDKINFLFDGEYDLTNSLLSRYEANFNANLIKNLNLIVESIKYEPGDNYLGEDVFKLFVVGKTQRIGVGLNYKFENFTPYLKYWNNKLEYFKDKFSNGNYYELGLDFKLMDRKIKGNLSICGTDGFMGTLTEVNSSIIADELIKKLTFRLVFNYANLNVETAEGEGGEGGEGNEGDNEDVASESGGSNFNNVITLAGAIEYKLMKSINAGIYLENTIDPDYKNNLRATFYIGVSL